MNTITMAYEAVNLFVLGIQRVYSLDHDAVKEVLDDLDLRFDCFGFQNSNLGGMEYYRRPIAACTLAGCNLRWISS